MGIVLDPAFGGRYTYTFEQLDGALTRLLLGCLLMREHCLRDLEAGLQHRVEGALRILKDHRDVPSANVANLLIADLHQVLVAEQDLATHDLAWIRHQAEERQRRHRLPAA